MSDPGWLTAQLPRAMAEDAFLRRFMAMFESIAHDTRARVHALEDYADPAVAPLAMVRFMASWIDLDLPETWPDERQRRFLREIGGWFRWRGTERGTVTYLEAVTGGAVQVADPAGIDRGGLDCDPIAGQPVVVTLHATGGLSDAALLETVAAVLPATVNFDLVIDADLEGRERARYLVRGLEVYDDQRRLASDAVVRGGSPKTAEPGERSAVTIDCPRCGVSAEVALPGQQRGDQFCGDCDFPLFWAPDIESPAGEPAATGP